MPIRRAIRWLRARWVDTSICVILVHAVAGCGSERVPVAGIEVSGESEPVTLLESEASGRAGMLLTPYQLRNVAGDTRVLDFVGTDCGCTLAQLGERSMLPGQKLTLKPGEKVTVNVAQRIPPLEGFYKNRAIFRVQQEAITLVSSARVVASWTIQPRSLVWVSDSKTSPSEMLRSVKITRRSRSEADLHNELCCATLPGIFADAVIISDTQPSAEVGGIYLREYQLEVTLRSPSSSDATSTRGRLLLRPLLQDNASAPKNNIAELAIPFAVDMRKGVRFQESVSLGSVEIGRAAMRKLVFSSADGQPFAIGRIVPSTDALAIEFSDQSRPVHIVDVRFTPKTTADANPILEIATTHPHSPNLKVSILASVSE